MSISLDKIEKNWNQYSRLCKSLNSQNIDNMIELLEGRLVECPASTKLDQYGAYIGGLVEHSLKVAVNMKNLSSLYKANLTDNSILKTGLFHDIGKLGDLNKSLYIEQDSQWHIDKLGQMYKFNEKLQKMSTSHRTHYLLQYFGIKLTSDEWIAIQIAQGSHFEENRFYVGSEPKLALILQQAKTAAIQIG